MRAGVYKHIDGTSMIDAMFCIRDLSTAILPVVEQIIDCVTLRMGIGQQKKLAVCVRHRTPDLVHLNSVESKLFELMAVMNQHEH